VTQASSAWGRGHAPRTCLYDPYFSLSIDRVDPLPHQLEAVYPALTPPFPCLQRQHSNVKYPNHFSAGFP